MCKAADKLSIFAVLIGMLITPESRHDLVSFRDIRRALQGQCSLICSNRMFLKKDFQPNEGETLRLKLPDEDVVGAVS